MGSPSKEDNLLSIILENSPLKHWHFEEFLKKSQMSRGALNKWLSRYLNEGLLKRKKPKGKFPYFVVGKDNSVYKTKKKQYMLNILYDSGLIKELLTNQKIKVAIVFGSAAKGDWYKDSDIDIFIMGKTRVNKIKYEKQLSKDIELHVFQDKEEIKKTKTGLIKNIINGYLIKGNIQQIVEVSV